jgi:hypothetical protein
MAASLHTFKAATKQQKLALLQPKKQHSVQKTAKHSDDEDDDEMLSGAFALINPINTMCGPIGEFQMEPQNFPRHPSVLFYGKRRTGKSFSCRDMLWKCFADYPFGICCTGTSYNGFWQKYIPPALVYQGLNQQALALLIERQKTLIQRWQKDHPDGDYKEADELRAFVLLGKQSMHRYYVVFSCCPYSKKLLNHYRNLLIQSSTCN